MHRRLEVQHRGRPGTPATQEQTKPHTDGHGARMRLWRSGGQADIHGCVGETRQGLFVQVGFRRQGEPIPVLRTNGLLGTSGVRHVHVGRRHDNGSGKCRWNNLSVGLAQVEGRQTVSQRSRISGDLHRRATVRSAVAGRGQEWNPFQCPECVGRCAIGQVDEANQSAQERCRSKRSRFSLCRMAELAGEMDGDRLDLVTLGKRHLGSVR
mmetsp:Transcript_18361/g.51187  ORF Transcript_18361/g.51187 Transcript_18361/m.51187 type:complete len:210 (-) Transcript_18361:306-935(-)